MIPSAVAVPGGAVRHRATGLHSVAGAAKNGAIAADHGGPCPSRHNRNEDGIGLLPSSGLLHVYTSLRPEVLRFLTARLGEPALAEDAMQELWLRLESGATGPIANPRAYLYRAAQNVALDMIRTRRRRVVRDGAWAVERGGAGDEPVDPTPGADQQIVEREETARLAAAIAALPEAAGRAFRMHKFDGLSHAEIAARLGISRSGVEKHIAVAMVHLRRALKD